MLFYFLLPIDGLLSNTKLLMCREILFLPANEMLNFEKTDKI